MARSIVDRLKDFSEKLKSGAPINAVRMTVEHTPDGPLTTVENVVINLPANEPLKPCPCCGSDPCGRPIMMDADDYGRKFEMGVVKCTQCGLSMETCCGQREAEMRWNRRK